MAALGYGPMATVAERMRRVSPAAAVAAGAALLFLAGCVWWSIADTRVPQADSAAHILYSLDYRDGLLHGDPFRWFHSYDIYPPLVHVLGIAAAAIGGVHVDSFVIGSDLLFVPLLAIGCYGAGRVAYGPWAGALAVVFAFGAPMLVSAFHSFLLDAPLTAMTALAVWLLLASQRFERTNVALAAGIVTGLGLMTKNTFPACVAGLLLIVLLRGGWRHWRGWLAYGVAAMLVAGPWYVRHALDQVVFANGVSVEGLAGLNDPKTLSPDDLAYYGWDALNIQLLLPLCLFAAGGTIAATVGWARRRAADDVGPELIVGMVVGWFLIMLSKHDDPRYTLPLLVYLAVLGTAWIVRTPRRWVRAAGAATLVAVALANAIFVSTGSGPTWSFSVPGRSSVSVPTGVATVLEHYGYVEAGPKSDGGLLSELRAAKRDGARHAMVESSSVQAYTQELTGPGVTLLLDRVVGLPVLSDDRVGALRPGDLFVFRRPIASGMPPPCARLGDGTGVYFARGGDLGPRARLWCPGRGFYAPLEPVYARPTPFETAGELHDQRALVRLFRGLRARGVRVVGLSSTLTADARFRRGRGIEGLAARAGVRVVPGDEPTRLSHHVAWAFQRPDRPDLPRPCLELPGGGRVYVERGGEPRPAATAHLLCP